MEAIQDNRHKGNGFKEWFAKVKKIKNIEIAVAVIALALILIIYAGVNGIKNKTEEKSVDAETDELEARLEDVLSNITGVGEVKVMITYEGSVEYITANTSNVNTTSTSDGNRINSTTSTTTSPVIVSSNGSSKPVIVKEIQPDIQGVIVVAEGAESAKVRLELIRAVMVALGVGADKVEIFPME
jgi:stage III sporulation protein AG